MTGAAPLFEAVAHGPDGGRADWLETTDGVPIRAVLWGAQAQKGTVLLFPGRTEYAEKYGPAAVELNARGYAVLTVDWRGQGIAGRMHARRDMGHVGRFTDYQKDVAALLAHARALSLPEPLYLVAHSMGGCIGLRALMEGLPVRAAMFSAPMWGIMMKGALRPFAWSLSSLSRPFGLSGTMSPGQAPHPYVLNAAFEENTLTNDPEMWAMMGRQIAAHPDLALGGPSLNWLYEALSEMRGLNRRPSPDYPVHVFLGTDEQIVDPARIHDRMGRWPGGELTVLEGGRHEVMMELPEMRTRFYDAARALFDAHR